LNIGLKALFCQNLEVLAERSTCRSPQQQVRRRHIVQVHPDQNQRIPAAQVHTDVRAHLQHVRLGGGQVAKAKGRDVQLVAAQRKVGDDVQVGARLDQEGVSAVLAPQDVGTGPPSRVSLPSPPSKVLSTALPVILLARLLPTPNGLLSSKIRSSISAYR
jgi:hypothetical protein